VYCIGSQRICARDRRRKLEGHRSGGRHWLGITAHSFSLIAFGADSIVELLSATLLLWRPNTELRRGEAFPDETERRAGRLAAALLAVLIVYVAARRGDSGDARGKSFSIRGLPLATLAIPIMYWLSTAKLRLADSIDSAALRADAIEAVACGYLSGIVVIGLLAQLSVGAWWNLPVPLASPRQGSARNVGGGRDRSLLELNVNSGHSRSMETTRRTACHPLRR
jgi:hypothetical protein